MPVPVTLNPVRLKQLMVERGDTVATLAAAVEVHPKTVYAVLGGRPTSLATAGRIYRHLAPGDSAGFFAEVAP